jgi:hypothetical protein
LLAEVVHNFDRYRTVFYGVYRVHILQDHLHTELYKISPLLKNKGLFSATVGKGARASLIISSRKLGEHFFHALKDVFFICIEKMKLYHNQLKP